MSNDKAATLKLLLEKTDQLAEATRDAIMGLAQEKECEVYAVMWVMDVALLRATLFMLHKQAGLPFSEISDAKKTGVLVDVATVRSAQARMLHLISMAHHGMKVVSDEPTRPQ